MIDNIWRKSSGKGHSECDVDGRELKLVLSFTGCCLTVGAALNTIGYEMVLVPRAMLLRAGSTTSRAYYLCVQAS